MPNLTIIKPGLMTSIQDLGRKGLGYFAVPNSGAMHVHAAKIALLLLHKNESAPLIECTSSAPHIEFNNACRIAITGADFNWTLNNQLVSLNAVIKISKGDVLKGQYAKDGLRAYIAIDGDLKVDQVYGSYSTYANARLGGCQGRFLQKGDILEWTKPKIVIRERAVFPIYKGPEFDLLQEQAKEVLINAAYKIGTDSNRMGLRLYGEKLASKSYQLEYSLPILPGFIQLPPSGLPIIVLQDGQTTGGYPRIAYVSNQHLPLLNQIPLGKSIRFEMQ